MRDATDVLGRLTRVGDWYADDAESLRLLTEQTPPRRYPVLAFARSWLRTGWLYLLLAGLPVAVLVWGLAAGERSGVIVGAAGVAPIAHSIVRSWQVCRRGAVVSLTVRHSEPSGPLPIMAILEVEAELDGERVTVCVPVSRRDVTALIERFGAVEALVLVDDARHRRKGRKLASALLALRPGEVDAVEPTVPSAAAVALPTAFSPRLLFASYLMCLGAFTLLGTGVVVTGLAPPLAAYAAVFAGGFAGGMLANRASPRGAILEPAAAGLLVGATLAGGWGWALETVYIARYAELTFVVVACAFLGALVGALAGQRTRAAPRSHSLARWSLVGAAIAAGALSAGIAVLALLSSLGADLPSAAGLLGFLLWPIMAGVATQAVAPRRMPHAGALGCVMVFGLLVPRASIRSA